MSIFSTNKKPTFSVIASVTGQVGIRCKFLWPFWVLNPTESRGQGSQNEQLVQISHQVSFFEKNWHQFNSIQKFSIGILRGSSQLCKSHFNGCQSTHEKNGVLYCKTLRISSLEGPSSQSNGVKSLLKIKSARDLQDRAN